MIIRVIGLGNMKVAMGLMDFTQEMLRSGYKQFVFDLSACKGLDSTFMGAMVGLAAAAQEDNGGAAVVNASTDNAELLQIVGADKFLKVAGPYKMEDIETERLDAPPPSSERRIELVKKAHENLVVIDQRNEARFGAFLRQLSNELAK
ncbi:MAG TPA: STAS domain-containing protein [Planctomycetota bacterium]|nr:STAS domain-containing protein [Planctomycetota bacterium]